MSHVRMGSILSTLPARERSEPLTIVEPMEPHYVTAGHPPNATLVPFECAYPVPSGTMPDPHYHLLRYTRPDGSLINEYINHTRVQPASWPNIIGDYTLTETCMTKVEHAGRLKNGDVIACRPEAATS